MKYIITKLDPTNDVGFGNQMYMIANAISYSVNKKINIIFLTKYLNQIKTDSYSNIGDIIDIPLTNKFLEKYNIQIADYNNFNFTINAIYYGTDNFNINIYDDFLNTQDNNNKLVLSKNISFSKYNEKINHLYIEKYFIPIKNDLCKLYISYTLDNITKTIKYDLIRSRLKEDIIIDFGILEQHTFPVFSDNSSIFYDTKTNLVFNKKFVDNASLFFSNTKINSNEKINCIHLRLENDAIEHWAKKRNLSNLIFKEQIEREYIDKIVKNIKKEDLTIILSSDYNNNVIKFLTEEKYNFLTTPSWSEYRDISAIYDLHIAHYCNNIYIGVFESSFSYLLLYRIKDNIKKFIQIIYEKKVN